MVILVMVTTITIVFNYKNITKGVMRGIRQEGYLLLLTQENIGTDEVVVQHGQVTTKYRDSIIEDDDEYRDRLIAYLKKWKVGLDEGQSELKIYQTLLDETYELLLMEHKTNTLARTQRDVELSVTLDCTNPRFSSFLRPEKRNKIVRVIDIFPFTYELTLLEVRLYELYDVVDEFVIFESNLTQRKIYKPLFLTQNIEKFSKFIDKITLMTPFNITKFNKNGTINQVVTVKDEDILSEYKRSYRIPIEMNDRNKSKFFIANYTFENKFRESIFTLYTKYVSKLDKNDLLIHGDLDEIPSSYIVNHFKYCQVKDCLYPFSFWSTFYVYKFKYLFKSDFPTEDDQYSLTFPNIYRYKDKIKLKKCRFSDGTILPKASGAHCNRFYGFMTDLFKAISMSDSTGLTNLHLKFMKSPTIESYYEIKEIFNSGKASFNFTERIKEIDTNIPNIDVFIPWIVKSNRESFQRFLE